MRSAQGPSPATGPVLIVEWPAERAVLDHLVENGMPCLVLVEEGSEPPEMTDCCQDWMWKSAGERETRIRCRQLALRALAHARARPYLDDFGLVHVGLRSVALPPKEERLMASLIRRFNRVVGADTLIRSTWPEGVSRPSVLSNRIARLRTRVSWLGLDIAGSSATGFVLLPGAGDEPSPDVVGFEAELQRPGARR